MSKKITKRVDGGMAIYYGIGSIIVAAGSFIAMIVWLFKSFSADEDFSWTTFIFFLILSAVMGVVGYSLLRIGYEEMED